MVDKKQELIKHCLYYKGEEECPFDGMSGYVQMWHCEKEYVEYELGTNKNVRFMGFKEIFSMDIEMPEIGAKHNTPINLLKALCCYYCYYNACYLEQLHTKTIVVPSDGGDWNYVSAFEGFALFLEKHYYRYRQEITM